MAAQVMEAPPKGEAAAAGQSAKVQGACSPICSFFCMTAAACDRARGPCLKCASTARRRSFHQASALHLAVSCDGTLLHKNNVECAGRTVIVTGGSQGVGKVLARKFAQQGFNVVVVARQADRCCFPAYSACLVAV